ncbi:hypothetical protein [Photorhabdus australis]|uniref:hypothetical protein n=1 Tax=Photorhabdus australis TaxID=286156 RepID=UPI003B8A7CE7
MRSRTHWLAELSRNLAVLSLIARTRSFFENLGVQTCLSDYNLGIDDIDCVVKQLEAHGMTHLGANRDITLDISRCILQASL